MRYVVGFLVSIGLVILVIVLIVRGFSGDGAKPSQTPLSDYANTEVQVRLTVDGPIVADSEHNAYRITVGQNNAMVETFRGYESSLIDMRSYENNPVSYVNFLKALDLAGFTNGVKQPGGSDERGVCAIGNRYIMEIINGSSRIQRFWTTSCRGGGTFRGANQEVRRLFRTQIPTNDLNKLTSGLNL